MPGKQEVRRADARRTPDRCPSRPTAYPLPTYGPIPLPLLLLLLLAGDFRYFFLVALSSLESTAMKASCGTSTEPTIFMRFLPSFCFSSSLRLREMSPP